MKGSEPKGKAVQRMAPDAPNIDSWPRVRAPFVRYTEGNQTADLWPHWREYPNGGNPGTAPILGRGNGLPSGFSSTISVNGAQTNWTSLGVDPYGVSVPIGSQSYNVPLFDFSAMKAAVGKSDGMLQLPCSGEERGFEAL